MFREAGEGKLDSQAGFSLAEILITIVIISVTFTAILGGLMTSITVSALHRKEVTADALARDGAEWVKDNGRNRYGNCATPDKPGIPGTYKFTDLPIPSDATGAQYLISVSDVKYWDGTSSNPLVYEPSGSTCVDHGLQDITVVATSPDGVSARETVEILKRTP